MASHAGTTPMGMLEVSSGSVNVILGRCCFSLDIRATTNEVRDACEAAPPARQWQALWEKSMQSLRLPVYRMPCGAGHGAMKLHNIMSQAMRFVRGQNSGISHNRLELPSSDDIDLAVHVFRALVQQVAQQSG